MDTLLFIIYDEIYRKNQDLITYDKLRHLELSTSIFNIMHEVNYILQLRTTGPTSNQINVDNNK